MMLDIGNACTLEELFEMWEGKHISEKKNNFIIDGIVNSEKWDAISSEGPKICLLLKESYFDSKSYEKDLLLPNCNLERHHWNGYIERKNGHYVYDLAKHLKEHAPWFMWCRVETWMSRLFALLGENVDAPIQAISVLNIKKSEGKPSSDYYDILRYAHDDRQFIRKELELIDPDIIICGATYDYCSKEDIFDDLHEITNLKDFGNRKVAHDGKRVILDCYHPSAPNISYDKAERFFKTGLQFAQML